MSNIADRTTFSLSALAVAAILAGCSPPAETPEQTPDAAATEPALQPEPAAQSADVKTFNIGALSAIALRDGGMDVPNDNKTFGLGRTPEDVAAVLAAAGQPTDKLSLSIQPLVVRIADRVLLLDTGAGSNMGPDMGHLANSMAAAGIDPSSISDVFISHLHGDHVGGLLTVDGEAAFPDATIHLSVPEWHFLTGLDAAAAQNFGITRHAALVGAMEPRVQAFEPGAEIIPGVVKAIEIKGHSPGHSGFLITSGEDSLLYVGDTLHHFVLSVQRPDWTVAFDGDAPTAEASRSALLADSAANGQRIYAVHFPFPGIGKVERRGEGFAWAAE
jgi:glyoxylase-like metal-dependent hydrolase (beta-lactamase superfamily II)